MQRAVDKKCWRAWNAKTTAARNIPLKLRYGGPLADTCFDFGGIGKTGDRRYMSPC